MNIKNHSELMTDGASFVCGHLVDWLMNIEYDVAVVDNLSIERSARAPLLKSLSFKLPCAQLLVICHEILIERNCGNSQE